MVEELRKSTDPDEWTLLDEMRQVPTSLATAIRAKKMLALNLDDGVVEVRVRNTQYTDDMKQRGDLWMRFVPNEEEA